MISTDFTETVIARIIQINIRFYDDSYAITPMCSFGTENGQSIFPTGIDSSGNAYVYDYGNNRMQNVLNDDTFILKCETFGTDKFIFPTDTTGMDSADNLYITDFDNNRGQKFIP